jgi:hypothetical protein
MGVGVIDSYCTDICHDMTTISRVLGDIVVLGLQS